MKKNLTKIFSTVLAAATALSVSAAPMAKKVTAPTGASAQATAVVKAQQKPAKTTRTRVIEPKVRTASSASVNVFKSASTRKSVPVKAPFKAGYKAADGMPDLLGSVVYADGWTSSELMGLYTIPVSASQSFEAKFYGPNATQGGVLVDGIYYVCNVETFYGYILGLTYEGYDVATGEKVYSQDFSYYTNSMTYDATTGTIYGISTVEQTPCLVELTFDAGEVGFNPVAVVETEDLGLWNSIACDSKGDLYGIYGDYVAAGGDYVCTGSTLYKIDKTTGATTKIGATGYDVTYASDCTFDTKTDRLYWTISPADEAGYIAEVNTTTGAATVLYQFPEGQEVCGLVVALPAAEPGAPAAVENIAFDFEGPALSGKISFTAPATTFDGAEATGDVTYVVTANGEEVATGTAAYGAEVTVDVTVAEAGNYAFVVYAKNSVGEGPKTKAAKYLGNDVPEAPKATATIDEETLVATVTWTPSVAGVHGGYLDAAAVTYDVTRYPGAVAVATDITETTVTDQLPEAEGMQKYFYEVVAKCNGLSSDEAMTGYVTIGSVVFVPPFIDTFDELNEGYTIIDANGDGKEWQLSGGNMRMTYNSSLDMDDWLISPAIELQAGKLYDVLADIWSQGTSFPERIEVKMGKAATIEAMTTVILEPTEFANGSSNKYSMSAPVTVDTDGKYYIGFHGMSDADMYYLNIDNFGVSAPRSAGAPAAVTDLTVVADPSGALSVDLAFNAPVAAINGTELTTIDKIEVSRDGEVVNTLENVAAGAALTYTDTPSKGGNYLYSVVAYNAEGAGLVAEQSVFVGFNTPEAPANVDMVESTETFGEVTITWDAVTADVDGRVLPADGVTYQVYAIEGNYRTPVSDKIAETSYTFQAVEPDKQDFVQYLVFAYYDGQESAGDYTPFLCVGTPYTSFSMTSEEDLDNYVLGTSSAGGAEWNIGNNESFTDVPEDADGTGLYFYMKAQYIDYYATLMTGKIDLSQTVNPGMYLYSMPVAEDDTNVLSVTVTDLATGESTEVFAKPVCELGEPMTWNKVTIDLSAFADKTVTFTVKGLIQAYGVVLIDGWKLASLLDYDLAASIKAPAKVAAGNDFNVDVTVTNEGLMETALFSVELYADGVVVDTKPCEGLKAGESVAVTFAQAFSPLAVEPVVYTAKVVYPADMNPANDEATATVVPVVSTLPTVSDLAATVEEAAIVLNWSEPDLNAAAGEPVTEDFEDADAFSATYGDWIFVDGDQSAVGGFQGVDVPGINPGETTGSFWIWDTAVAATGNSTFEAHSGTHYLFGLFRYDDGTVDDWAISPALDGNAQTISFYAKSYSSQYPDKIEVYYSTGSTETADFVKVEGVGGVCPQDWTLYEAELPAGATRFAIRSCATSSFMLMVDDVTFVPAGAAANLDIVGYNVYRDGVKINDAVVEENTFTDANVEPGKYYTYVVTTVYTKGESAASNEVTVQNLYVGIDNVYGTALNIAAAKNQIIVTGAYGLNVAVYTVDGKTIFSGAGEAKNVIPAQQGVYVVKAGNTVKKVLVK